MQASEPTAAAATDEGPGDQEKRGRYIAIAAHCRSCHTGDPEAPYAGGYTIDSDFGELVTPNITPDPETGSGRWDRDDFAATLHRGETPDGAPLYPAMPYLYYTRMTDDEALSARWFRRSSSGRRRDR